MNSFLKKYSGFGIVLFFSILLSVFMFGKHFTNFGEILFGNVYDGIKNYYGMKSYIMQPPEFGYTHYRFMNYPFGDNILFVDITPAFSVPMRWCYLHLHISPDNLIGCFDLFIILQLILTAPVLYLLFQRLQIPMVWSILSSLIVSFTNPQLLKLAGHFNLSITLAVALTCLLLQKSCAAYSEKKFTTSYIQLHLLALVVLFYSFIHFYYFIVLLPFIMMTIGFYSLRLLYRKELKINFVLHAVFSTVWVTVLVFGIAKISNPFPQYPRPIGGGYNWDVWTMQLSDLYRTYNNIQTLHFFGSKPEFYLERFGFIGNMFLGLIICIMVLYLIKLFKKNSNANTHDINSQFVSALFLSGLFMLFMSLGDVLRNDNHKFISKNFLNPLYYLDQHIEIIKQFRCLGRLFFPFYLSVYIASIYLLFRLFKRTAINKNFIYLFVAPALVAGIIDTHDFTTYFRRDYSNKNIIFEKNVADCPSVSNQTFQAILPVPYFHVGSGESGLTIDDDDNWSKEIFRVSIKNMIPLMASKMARTPNELAAMQLNTLLNYKLDDNLKSRMDNRSVLVMYNPDFNSPPDLPYPAGQVVANRDSFIHKVPLVHLFDEGRTQYYAWKIK